MFEPVVSRRQERAHGFGAGRACVCAASAFGDYNIKGCELVAHGGRRAGVCGVRSALVCVSIVAGSVATAEKYLINTNANLVPD